MQCTLADAASNSLQIDDMRQIHDMRQMDDCGGGYASHAVRCVPAKRLLLRCMQLMLLGVMASRQSIMATPEGTS